MVSVLSSLVAPDALSALAEQHYALSGAAACRIISLNDNDNYLITVPGATPDKYVLRVWPRGKHWLEQESDYQFELEWLDFLFQRGLPVAPPVRRTDGGFLGTLEAPEGTRYWALFQFAPGAGGLSVERCRPYGESIARIHLVSNEFQPSYERISFDLARLTEKPIQQMRAWYTKYQTPTPEELDHVTSLAEELAADVRAYGSDPNDEWGIIGGDFHGGNHHFTEDGQLTHFDFDLCAYSWRAYDLAIFLWSAGSQDPAKWAGFLDGYTSVRPLSERERSLLPAMVALRHIWWMGSHTMYPSAPGWLGRNSWDYKFNRLKELEQTWRNRDKE